MGQAVLTFLGVILGAAIAGWISLWQVQLVTRREREARQQLREQERQDRRDAFQRESILALQDAVEDIRKVGSREYQRQLGVSNGEGGHWQPFEPGDNLPEEWTDADARVTKLRARVLDGELENLVGDFQRTARQAIDAQTQEQAADKARRASSLAHEVNSRIGVMLKNLF